MQSVVCMFLTAVRDLKSWTTIPESNPISEDVRDCFRCLSQLDWSQSYVFLMTGQSREILSGVPRRSTLGANGWRKS